VKFLCDFDMWCIRCYLPSCTIVLTTAMDLNKVEVEVFGHLFFLFQIHVYSVQQNMEMQKELEGMKFSFC
jgi:hypothetical protein